jgi:hypothetical protein
MTATMTASTHAGIGFARPGRRAGSTLGARAVRLGSLAFAAGIWSGSFALHEAVPRPATTATAGTAAPR